MEVVGHMIADFRYQSEPNCGQVIVRMFWGNDGRMGELIVPKTVENTIRDQDMPDIVALPVISAVSYAIVLAEMTSTPLCLAGDRSVWDPQWGQLIEPVPARGQGQSLH
jgi:hypothetical protein